MISQGYFSLNEEILKEIYKKFGYKKAKDFLWEMLTYGGRIYYHTYDIYIKKLEDLAKKRIRKNWKSF